MPGLSIECFEKSRRGVPLLPLQTLVDYHLLYCGRQCPRYSTLTPTTPSPQPSWPIGQDVVTSESNNDEAVGDRTEPSIFHDHLATSVLVPKPTEVVVSSTARPMSMFDIPRDGRGCSTATMSTVDDMTSAGGMSDEARTAMLDIVGERPNSPANLARSKPGIPLARVANELQAARQMTSKTLTTLQSDESASLASEGKGDSLIQAGAALYPGLNSSTAKTLLDYYTSKASERNQQPSRRQYSPPRVTMSFFPTVDKDASSPPLPPTPTPTPVPANPDSRPVRQQASASPPTSSPGPPRRMQSAAAGTVRASTPAADAGRRQSNEHSSELNATKTTTTTTAAVKPDAANSKVLKPVHTVTEKCDNLSPKTATVAEKCDSRRISPLSRRFRRQSHFSATVWTGYRYYFLSPLAQSR